MWVNFLDLIPEAGPLGGDNFCRADEHGHVAVVPAGVRHPWFLGADVLFIALVTIRIFLNVKLCEIQ